jgi:hypothetical protein
VQLRVLNTKMENKNISERRYKRRGGEEGYVGGKADNE